MSARAQIERWSREELEDRFHTVSGHLQSLKQNNNRLEKEVKILNGRIGGRRGGRESVPNGPAKDELDELHRTNQLMAQKLKVLKHQLLNYTKMNATTAGRAAYHQQQKVPPAGTRGQGAKIANGRIQQQRENTRPNNVNRGRPQTAAVANSSTVAGPSGKRVVASAAGERQQFQHEKANEQQKVQIVPDSPERSIRQNGATELMTPSTHDDFLAIPERMEQQSHQQRIYFTTLGNSSGALDDRVRELQKQSRAMANENDELRFNLDKSEQRLGTLRTEYDRVAQALAQAQRELRTQSESLSSARAEAERRQNGGTRSAEIADRELAILREECRALSGAHDRLVARSLEQETSGRVAVEELARLRAQLQQYSSESETERREWELERQRWRMENRKLRERQSQTAREEAQNGVQSIREEKRKPNNPDQQNGPTSAGDQNYQQQNGGELLLNKLFTDVIGIVDTHFATAAAGNANYKMPLGDERNPTEKWQKLYEEVYAELEKVRRLLLSEHQINEGLKEEKRQMEAEKEMAKLASERRLEEMNAELEERDRRMALLERELEAVAKSGQIRHITINRDSSDKKNGTTILETMPAIEPTELTLQITKISLTEDAIRQAQNPCPVMFLAVEFFDFEIQTTRLMNGPEANPEFSTAFELTVSDLFVHYLQTEAMAVELYKVSGGLNYELWAQAQIPLKKLLSAQTPTQFHGDLKFRTNDMLLATMAYAIQVPFSLLRALSAQRRRMAATAMIPIGPTISDEPFNELTICIHRCIGLNLLKNGQAPSAYVAYEFFHFPVHMTRAVRHSNNPVFDDQQSWKLPAGSEAVHKYLKEKELLLYVIDEEDAGDGGDRSVGSSADQKRSRALGRLSLPLFPLARNQKIRGTFPLIDRSDDSTVSNASMDVSIFWKFAYTFDGTEQLDVEKLVQMKKSTIPEESKKDKAKGQEEVEIGPIKPPAEPVPKPRRSSKELDALQRVNAAQLEKEGTKSSISEELDEEEEEEEELNEEMAEEELRKRLFAIPEPKRMEKFKSDTDGTAEELEQPSQPREEVQQAKPDLSSGTYDPDLEFAPSASQIEADEKEHEDKSQISEPGQMPSPKSSTSSSSSTAPSVVDGQKSLSAGIERTTSSEISEDLLKDEEEDKEHEDEEDDTASLKSDATYTAEGPLGPIELDEPGAIAEEKPEVEEDEEEMVIEDKDLEGRGGVTTVEPAEKPPVPAVRRSLLGQLPPIQGQKRLAPQPPTESAEQNHDNELPLPRKSVDFTDPLHSSIPPSDVSSSFAEDLTLGSARSSGSSASSQENGNGNGKQQPAEGAERPKPKRRRKPPKRSPVQQDAAMPPTPAIRIRTAPAEQLAHNQHVSEADGGAGVAAPTRAVVQVEIVRLRVLEHSALLHPHLDGTQVFVEWNFLDFERDQCETEGTIELPRRHTETALFNQRRAYELNPTRIALLRQWTELNIRLTFTLVMDPAKGDEELDDLCMGELDLLEVLDSSNHSLLMRNVDNLAVAVLEVNIDYSETLLEYLREVMHGDGDVTEQEESYDFDENGGEEAHL